MTYENKDVYKGRFKNGMVGAYLVIPIYIIMFILCQRNGSGKLVSKLKGTYEGSWEDDLCHGAGKQVYPNGDIYEGAWERNKVKYLLFIPRC